MTDQAAPIERAGQSNAQPGSERSHTLVVFADDQQGSLDRVVGVLRRRRARLQSFALGRSEQPGVMRITVVTNDSEVGVEQLVEQLRKIVNVRHIINLSSELVVARELALIKVNGAASHFNEISELGHLFGAHVVDVAKNTVTLDGTASEDKVEKLVPLFQDSTIHHVSPTS